MTKSEASRHRQRLQIAMIGNAHDHDLREAVEQLRSFCDLTIYADPGQAAALLSKANKRPSLFVIAQTRPGCFSHHAIAQLQASFPLTRCVALLGSWCEGESRSGSPWPGVTRVYWHQWIARLHRELTRLSAGTASPWGMSSTAPPVEQALLLGQIPMPRATGKVIVATSHYDTFDPLADMILSMGMVALWWPVAKQQRVREADVILWDLPRTCSHRRAKLRDLQQQLPASPVVALVDFPRRFEVEQLRAWGVEQIVGRPFQNDDLAHSILQCVGITPQSQTVDAAA